MTIRNELIDELLAGQDPSSVMRQDGLLGELKKALLNRLMAAEFEHHLTQDQAAGEGKNHRNGSSRKRVLTDDSHVEVTIPRDREARFDPVLIGKYQRRLPGFDDKVISLYTRGMSTREIQGHLEEIYGAEVSPQLISTVTDAVTAEVAEWQSRPLEPLYPVPHSVGVCQAYPNAKVMFFDAIRVKIRDQGTVCNKAVYLALGITSDGRKHILGLWIDPNEGAKFWLRIVNELRNRGVKDILIAVVDGLKGFPEAINAAFPQTLVQTCIVHLLRNALAYVSWQDRRQVVAALKPIYQAPTADAALLALDAFEAGPWGQKYAAIAPLWRRQWDQVIPFFAFPPEVRRIIYTTNAIESLNSTLRTAVRSRGHFPTDEAAIKLLYLVLRRVCNDWKNAQREWTTAMTQFAIMFGDRFSVH
ncbi:MAG: IS256 family transposase [Rhodopila sp.]|nr:IS256 family transposase [Rhodopila sp.]